MGEFRDSEEWKCLNKIWKKLPAESREECYEDFQILSEKLKKIWRLDDLASSKDETPDFGYINDLSVEARELFFYALEHENKNLYHSAMAVIQGHGLHGMTEAIEFYMKRYMKRRPYIQGNESAMREIVALCYKRLEERDK